MEQTELYRQKLTTAAEAVKEVRSGDWVDYGWCTGTPEALDRALAARYEELHDVKVRGGIIFHRPAIMSVPDAPEHFTWNSWHMSGVERKTLERHRKYILAMLLIQTNGYEIIRGHLRHVLRRRGGLTA